MCLLCTNSHFTGWVESCLNYNVWRIHECLKKKLPIRLRFGNRVIHKLCLLSSLYITMMLNWIPVKTAVLIEPNHSVGRAIHIRGIENMKIANFFLFLQRYIWMVCSLIRQLVLLFNGSHNGFAMLAFRKRIMQIDSITPLKQWNTICIKGIYFVAAVVYAHFRLHSSSTFDTSIQANSVKKKFEWADWCGGRGFG